MSSAKDRLHDFLTGLDSGDRQRLKDAAKAALTDYVEDMPGPDAITRPVAEKAIEKLIDDYCTDT